MNQKTRYRNENHTANMAKKTKISQMAKAILSNPVPQENKTENVTLSTNHNEKKPTTMPILTTPTTQETPKYFIPHPTEQTLDKYFDNFGFTVTPVVIQGLEAKLLTRYIERFSKVLNIPPLVEIKTYYSLYDFAVLMFNDNLAFTKLTEEQQKILMAKRHMHVLRTLLVDRYFMLYHNDNALKDTAYALYTHLSNAVLCLDSILNVSQNNTRFSVADTLEKLSKKSGESFVNYLKLLQQVSTSITKEFPNQSAKAKAMVLAMLEMDTKTQVLKNTNTRISRDIDYFIFFLQTIYMPEKYHLPSAFNAKQLKQLQGYLSEITILLEFNCLLQVFMSELDQDYQMTSPLIKVSTMLININFDQFKTLNIISSNLFSNIIHMFNLYNVTLLADHYDNCYTKLCLTILRKRVNPATNTIAEYTVPSVPETPLIS